MLAQVANLAYVAGDTLPTISLELTDLAGAPRDLTGYTAQLAYRVSPTRVVTVAANTSQANLGILMFPWGATDLDTPGSYAVQVTLTSPTQQVETFQRFYLSIAPRATAPVPT